MKTNSTAFGKVLDRNTVRVQLVDNAERPYAGRYDSGGIPTTLRRAMNVTVSSPLETYSTVVRYKEGSRVAASLVATYDGHRWVLSLPAGSDAAVLYYALLAFSRTVRPIAVPVATLSVLLDYVARIARVVVDYVGTDDTLRVRFTDMADPRLRQYVYDADEDKVRNSFRNSPPPVSKGDPVASRPNRFIPGTRSGAPEFGLGSLSTTPLQGRDALRAMVCEPSSRAQVEERKGKAVYIDCDWADASVGAIDAWGFPRTLVQALQTEIDQGQAPARFASAPECTHTLYREEADIVALYRGGAWQITYR